MYKNQSDVNYSQRYFKNLKDFLETQQNKSAYMMYRRKLREHQDKINYTNELQRIRGELSRNDTRLPSGSIKHLKDRVEKLKQLGGQVVDQIN